MLFRSREEVERFGLQLQPADSGVGGFQLVDRRTTPPRVVERFYGELWTELEAAQAAVRFARYFLADGAPAADSA